MSDKKIDYTIRATSIVDLEDNDGATTIHRGTNFTLSVAPPLEISHYLDEKGYPNEAGCEAINICFIQGLIANMNHAHLRGYRDKFESVKAIVDELRRAVSRAGVLREGHDH